MKKIFFVIIFFNLIAFSQEKEFILIDGETNLPISQVQVFYKELNEGSVTNNNGKTKISIRNNDLSIIHINYAKKIIEKNDIQKIDTIRLTEKIYSLQEVDLRKTDLEGKLKYVLENYDNLYVDYPTEKECSFKETFIFDGEFKRLFLAELRWWSQSSAVNYKKKYGKFIKLKLGKINYNNSKPLNLSKNKKNKKKENNSGAITTKSLINFFYLNHAIKSLLLPNKTGKIESSIDKIDKSITIISYTTNWKVDLKGVSNRNIGKITFDNKTNAIIRFTKDIEYKNRINETTNDETNITKIIEYKNNSFEYDFVKNKNDKWSLKHFNTSINILLTYDKKLHKLNFSNSLYVLKESKVKKVNNDGLMDLDKPIYKNLPSEAIINANNILLTKKEKNFIYDTNE